MSNLLDEPVRARPWWGLGDAVAIVPLIIVISTVGSVIGLFVSGGRSVEDLTDPRHEPAVLALGLVGQQLTQAVWPFIVSAGKGLGAAVDWRLRFAPRDLWLGPLTGFACLLASGIVTVVVTAATGLDDPSDASNSGFLSDASGSPWLVVLILGVVIGAPVSEELLFRGLVLRAFEKRGGQVLAVIGSTVAFTLPHFISTSPEGLITLLAGIGTVGLVLALVVLAVDRLGTVIIAHATFNAVGVWAALG